MKFDDLTRLRNLVPPDLHVRTFIAGGFAANPNKANDIDLWIVGDEPHPDVAEKILRHLGNNGHDITVRNFPFYTDVQLTPGRTVWFRVCDVNDFYSNGKRMPVQIMATTYHDVDELLAYFDLSPHKKAIAISDGLEIIGRGFTTPDEQPRATRFDTPHSTLRRYFRLCERYGHRPNWDDVNQLCQAVVLNDRQKALLRGESNT